MINISGYDECHCLALKRGSRQLTRIYDSYLAPAELTISQFSVLSVIDKKPGVRMTELAQIMVMERTTLIRSLKPLQADGLIASGRDPGERAHSFELTRSGQERLAAAVPLWKAAQAAFEEKVGEERAARVRDDNLSIVAAISS